jgi:membrane-associated phospholipid phosphatase
VLLAALPCYGLLPWLETQPPRSIEGGQATEARNPVLRRANLGLLRVASVQANTFPSGHAAASTAAGLALVPVSPLAGAAFLAIALSIAIASVVGRYHYTLDAVLGVLAGVVAFALSRAA